MKAQMGAGERLPRPFKPDGTPTGKVFLTVKNHDKPQAVQIARELAALVSTVKMPKNQSGWDLEGLEELTRDDSSRATDSDDESEEEEVERMLPPP